MEAYLTENCPPTFRFRGRAPPSPFKSGFKPRYLRFVYLFCGGAEKRGRKGLFRLLEISNSSSLQEWPQTTQFTWFSVAVRPKNLVNTHMVFELSVQKWWKKDQKPGNFLSERVFSAFGGFTMAQKRWYLHGFVHLPGTKPANCDGFGPCTLQSGVFSAPPVFKSVASNHAIYSLFNFFCGGAEKMRKDCVGKGFVGFWRFQTPPVWQSGLKPWLSGQRTS